MLGFATTAVLVASVFLSAAGNMVSEPMAGPQPIVLDDMDASLKSEMVKVFRGSYAPCMEDAYNQQYHHDCSKNKGNASFTFKFAPPADGCYILEEHHPGNSPECSHYLPRNARLDIEYCKGKSTTTYINQAVKGGQWNVVGRLPFFKGHEGSFTMRNALNEQCEAQSHGDWCYWVVDAFRLTWTGHECSSGGKSKDAVQTNEGVLLLRLNIADGDDMASMQMKIQDQKAVLEVTLATHFGYKSVNIVDARFVANGRRLREQPIALMHIRLIAREKVTESKGDDLKQALQAKLDTISPGTIVDSASVEWSLAEPVRLKDGPNHATTSLLFYLGIGIGCAALLVMGIAGLLVWKLRACRVRTTNVQNVEVRALEAEPAKDKPEEFKQAKEATMECALVKEVPEDTKKAKEADEVETSSVSTGPPTSEDGTHSAGNSIPGPDQKNEEKNIQHL